MTIAIFKRLNCYPGKATFKECSQPLKATDKRKIQVKLNGDAKQELAVINKEDTLNVIVFHRTNQPGFNSVSLLKEKRSF